MKPVTRIFITFILFLLISATAAAIMYWYNWQKNSPAEVSSLLVEPKELFVGESIKLNLEITTPWYRQVNLPISLTSNQDASLTEAVTLQHALVWQGNLWKIQTEIVTYSIGEFEELTLKIPLSPDRENKQKELLVKLPKISVKAAGFNARSMVDYKKEMSKSDLVSPATKINSEKNKWILPIIILTVLVILICVYLYFTRRKTKQLSYSQLAFQNLKNLKNEKNLSDEIFFVRLTDILRVYIEKRFSLPATEKTSEEFIQHVREGNQLSTDHRAALENFLQLSDLVKFAKMSASEKQRLDCLTMAEKFINETTPQQNEVQK